MDEDNDIMGDFLDELTKGIIEVTEE